MRRVLPVLAALMMLGAAAHAAELKRIGAPEALIAQAVVVPPGSRTVYLSGITASATNADAPKGAASVYGDTKTQALNIFAKMAELLKREGMGMGDIAMMRVYLVADPNHGGKMDFAGMNEAYRTFFGTTDQPNKPARVTVQVASLAGADFLVEIEAQAVQAPGPVKTVHKTTKTTMTTVKGATAPTAKKK